MAEWPNDDEDGLLNGKPTTGDRATFLVLVILSAGITLILLGTFLVGMLTR